MDTTRNGRHGGLIEWADEELVERATTNGHSKVEERPAEPVALAVVEKMAEAERRAIAAEARAAALSAEVDRAEMRARRLQDEVDGERRRCEAAEQARLAAESRLAEAREAVWRWLTKLARTPFWRLRRVLAEPPVELQGQPRLAPPCPPAQPKD